MKLGLLFLSTFALAGLASAEADAAVVAVMPVQGVNLTEGQCDAIGVLFANAFARETNVAVVSPLDTKPLLAQGQSHTAAAGHLGVREYVVLRALQLGERVTLAGIRYTREGQEVFRSETAATDMDDMEQATARLARSLAWRLPVARPIAPGPPPEIPAPPARPSGYPKALGVKGGIWFPTSLGSDASFEQMVSFQFAGRVGTRESFVEFGVGAAIPASSVSSANQISMGGVFAEIGGGFHLAQGGVAPYLAGGISPRIWHVDAQGDMSGTGATLTVHGTAGITFTRDSRARVYGEIRISQYLIGLKTETSSYSSPVQGPTYHPTEFGLQVGVGW